jgi:hypothetical protein
MKKISLFCLILLKFLPFQVSAQYDNSTLTGPWFFMMPPANPYGDSLMYIVFDGIGNVTAFSGFCSSVVGGPYTVSSTGGFTINLSCNGENYQMSGQLTSYTAGTLGLDQTYNLIKVSNPGALAGTLSGTLYTNNCGANNVTLTLDNKGVVISATGLTPTVSGRVYAEGGMFKGHFTTGASNAWNECSISGYYSNNTLNGKVDLDANDCGNTSAQLIREDATGIISVNSNKTKIEIFPNPTNDIVTINMNNISNEVVEINIFNVNGNLVKSETMKQNNRQINIGDLSNGIYMVEIKSKEWTEKQKLLIQR